MRNLKRITNYFNRLEAWREWEKIIVLARAYGIEYEDIAPSSDDSWKKIDLASGILSRRIVLRKLVGENTMNLDIQLSRLRRNQWITHE